MRSMLFLAVAAAMGADPAFCQMANERIDLPVPPALPVPEVEQSTQLTRAVFYYVVIDTNEVQQFMALNEQFSNNLSLNSFFQLKETKSKLIAKLISPMAVVGAVTASPKIGHHLFEFHPSPGTIDEQIAEFDKALNGTQINGTPVGGQLKPLDFTLGQGRIVVIGMEGPNAHFTNKYTPMTLKGNYRGSYYNLRFANGCKKDCKAIRFNAWNNPKGVDTIDGLTLNITFDMDRAGTPVPVEIGIDPDVNNQGGGGNP